MENIGTIIGFTGIIITMIIGFISIIIMVMQSASQTRTEINARVDRVETRIDKLDNRIDRLENKIDILLSYFYRKDIDKAA